MVQKQTCNKEWSTYAEFFEYTSAANPVMPTIDVKSFPASLHQIKKTSTIPLDLSKDLKLPYPATCPALLASYIHISPRDQIKTSAVSRLIKPAIGNSNNDFTTPISTITNPPPVLIRVFAASAMSVSLSPTTIIL